MGRLQLALQPGDSFDLNLKVEGARSRSEMGQPEFFGTIDPLTGGPCAPVLAGQIDNTRCTDLLGYTDTDGDPFKGDWAREAVYDIDSTAVTLTMNADVGAATLTSVSGYVDFERTFDIDSRCYAGARGGLRRERRHPAVSQELRLAASGERLDWIVGAFYSKDEVVTSIPGAHDDLLITRTLVDADQDTKSAAGFAHGEWHLDGQSRSRHRPALHVGRAALHRWHHRPEPVRLQLHPEPDLHAGIRRAGAADVRRHHHRRSQLVVARRPRIPAAAVAAGVRDDLARHEERRLLLRYLDRESAARAVRTRGADGV